MDNSIKQRWVEALRSGNYKQVKYRLKGYTEGGDVGYCCLGVFCSIMGKEPESLGEYDGYVNFSLYNFCNENIPAQVSDKGISMNDCSKSFTEIADMIEKEWKDE